MSDKKMILDTLTHVGNMKDTEFSGYHKFRDDDGGEYGSFEVFHQDERCIAADIDYAPGWYWWSCFPGCLPDGDQNGPFPTAEGAYLDATEGSELPNHGDWAIPSDNETFNKETDEAINNQLRDVGFNVPEGDEPAGYSDYKEG